ncbi:DNA-binding domain-containing protein [Burkholderia latens]|uniref:HvfC/BufC N-terminal domain-containing protein n=1 Tax=Burkholderia latens TaxID=488446 RepID=UPI00158F23C2|nr:DNA-binding domain-containing protein [Burkholderia latens]
MKNSLKQVQLEFATSLIHPNVEDGLLASLAGDLAKNRSRIARYRANLRRTWHRALVSAYPVVRSLLGDEFFLTLAREYGTADPSQSSDLNRFGARLAELLEAWPPTATVRYLADVARLEWAVHRAHFAADTVEQPPEKWMNVPVDALENCSVQMHPAVHLLHTSTRAADRWFAFRSYGEKPVLCDADWPQWMVITRPRWIPEVVAISEEAFMMLRELRDGATIGEARRAVLSSDGNFELEGNWQQWIEDGIIVAAKFGKVP